MHVPGGPRRGIPKSMEQTSQADRTRAPRLKWIRLQSPARLSTWVAASSASADGGARVSQLSTQSAGLFYLGTRAQRAGMAQKSGLLDRRGQRSTSPATSNGSAAPSVGISPPSMHKPVERLPGTRTQAGPSLMQGRLP